MEGTSESLSSLLYSSVPLSTSPPSSASRSADSRDRTRPDDCPENNSNPLCGLSHGRRALDGASGSPRLVMVESCSRSQSLAASSSFPLPGINNPRLLSSAADVLLLEEISLSVCSFTCMPLEGHPIFIELGVVGVQDPANEDSVCTAVTTKPIKPNAAGDLACARWTGSWTIPMRGEMMKIPQTPSTPHQPPTPAAVDSAGGAMLYVRLCAQPPAPSPKQVFAQKEVRMDHLNVRKDCRYSLQCRVDGANGLLTVGLKSLPNASGMGSPTLSASGSPRRGTDFSESPDVRWKKSNSVRRLRSGSSAANSSPRGSSSSTSWWRSLFSCF